MDKSLGKIIREGEKARYHFVLVVGEQERMTGERHSVRTYSVELGLECAFYSQPAEAATTGRNVT